MIQSYQPIAQFGLGYTYVVLQGVPACVKCLPGCSSCSDAQICTACSSGTLLEGLCLRANISATSGIADSTNFLYNVTEFEGFNSHLITELRLNPSSPAVQFTSLKLIYPDSSVVTISDPSSFKVPLYAVEGQISFSVSVILVFSVIGVSKEVSLSTISLTQDPYVTPIDVVIQNTRITPLDDNICGCRANTECNKQTGQCTCEAGYGGTYCTFTQEDLLTLQNQVTTSFNVIESKLSSLTTNQVLISLNSLTVYENALSVSTALKIVTLVTTLISLSSSESELTQATEVLSNSISFAQNTKAGISIIEAITKATDSIVSTAIEKGTVLSISSTNLQINVESIIPSTPMTVSHSSQLILTLPAGLLGSEASNVQLSTVLYKNSLYQSVAPSGTNQATDTLSIELYQDKSKQKISGLTENIQMEFKLSSRDSITKSNIDMIVKGNKPLTDITCSYFDTTSQSISSEGCTVLEVTITSIKCGCNHMTDFMSFLKTGLSVLEGSNYDVLLAVTQLTPENLKSNVGFYFALGYWGSFALFCILLRRVDKRKMQDKFFDQLFLEYLSRGEKMKKVKQEIASLQQEQKQFKSDRYIKELDEKSGGIYSIFTKRKESASYLTSKTQVEGDQYLNQAIMLSRKKNKQFLQGIHRETNQSRAIDTSLDELQNGRSTPVVMDNWIEEKEESAPKSSKIQKIKQRIDQTLEKERRCCCAFGKLCKSELASNNQVYNLVTLTSLLNTRPVRLSLFYLAVVLEFALNALFYNLSPTDDDDAPIFWDVIISNFWVALYSTLFAMLPLLLMGLILTVPSKWNKQLEQAQSVESLKQSYLRLKRKLQCKAIAGFVVFALFSNFMLLYIICFCHVANERMSKDWARSSSLTIILDLLVFELAPAIVVAFLAVMRGYCRGCRGLMCFIILIELYRLYRNLIEG